VPQWIELAELARRNNFDQVWVNDNLGYRNVFVILTAIASRVPIKLGTAILVPYFRNPVDTADAFAALSELVDGYEKALPLIGCSSFGDSAPSWSETVLPRERLSLTDPSVTRPASQ